MPADRFLMPDDRAADRVGEAAKRFSRANRMNVRTHWASGIHMPDDRFVVPNDRSLGPGDRFVVPNDPSLGPDDCWGSDDLGA